MRRSKFAGFVAATGLTLAMVGCGSSSNSTATTATTRAAASGSTTASPATTAANAATTTTTTAASGGAGKVQATLTGDVNASLTADATAPVTCSQNPSKIVLKGDAGGHRGTITITPQGGTSGNIDVAYLPDGVGGPQYLAAHIPYTGGDSRGFVNLNAAGSGNLDVALPYVAGSSGSFNGSSVHVKATWTC